MASGTDSYAAAVKTDGPVGWYRFSELNAGQAVSAGGQDPQNFCMDSSVSGNLNPGAIPYPNGNYLQYGSAVIGNSPGLLLTRGPNGGGGAALFPNTATASSANVAQGGLGLNVTLQPTAQITVASWVKPAVIVGGSKQVVVAYGSDASALSAYNLFHNGTTAINHTFQFAINIGGALKTATATLPVVVAGTTYYAVGTYDGINVRIYVNGVLQGTTAATGAISYASLGGLGLAFGNDPSLTDANIQGTIDDSGIYNYALSATRIAYHYRQGSVPMPFVWRH